MNEKRKIYIANDHAGYEAKHDLLSYLDRVDCEVIDLGCTSNDRVDYPDFARKLAHAIQNDQRQGIVSEGILICGSGIGISMVANRFSGIRAALCRNGVESRLSKQHNDANVLCLNGRLSRSEERESIVKSWLEASFEGGRHQTRLDKFSDIGEKA